MVIERISAEWERHQVCFTVDELVMWENIAGVAHTISAFMDRYNIPSFVCPTVIKPKGQHTFFLNWDWFTVVQEKEPHRYTAEQVTRFIESDQP